MRSQHNQQGIQDDSDCSNSDTFAPVAVYRVKYYKQNSIFDQVSSMLIRPPRFVYNEKLLTPSKKLSTRFAYQVRNIPFPVSIYWCENPKYIVLYLHGNSSSRFEGYLHLKDLPAGACLACFDFNGCGLRKQSSFITLGKKQCVQVDIVAEYLKKQFGMPVVGWGRSMGAVSLLMSSKCEIMVVDSPFSSLYNLCKQTVQQAVPAALCCFIHCLFPCVFSCIRSDIESKTGMDPIQLQVIQSVKRMPSSKTLIVIAGKNDSMISHTHSQLLFNSFKGDKKKLILFEGTHNSNRPYDVLDECFEQIHKSLKESGIEIFTGKPSSLSDLKYLNLNSIKINEASNDKNKGQGHPAMARHQTDPKKFIQLKQISTLKVDGETGAIKKTGGQTAPIFSQQKHGKDKSSYEGNTSAAEIDQSSSDLLFVEKRKSPTTINNDNDEDDKMSQDGTTKSKKQLLKTLNKHIHKKNTQPLNPHILNRSIQTVQGRYQPSSLCPSPLSSSPSPSLLVSSQQKALQKAKSRQRMQKNPVLHSQQKIDVIPVKSVQQKYDHKVDSYRNRHPHSIQEENANSSANLSQQKQKQQQQQLQQLHHTQQKVSLSNSKKILLQKINGNLQSPNQRQQHTKSVIPLTSAEEGSKDDSDNASNSMSIKIKTESTPKPSTQRHPPQPHPPTQFMDQYLCRKSPATLVDQGRRMILITQSSSVSNTDRARGQKGETGGVSAMSMIQRQQQKLLTSQSQVQAQVQDLQKQQLTQDREQVQGDNIDKIIRKKTMPLNQQKIKFQEEDCKSNNLQQVQKQSLNNSAIYDIQFMQ